MNQVLKLSDIIANSQLSEIEFVRARYEREALNYSETVDFLEKQNLLKAASGALWPTSVFKSFLRQFVVSDDRLELLKSFLVDSLFDRDCSFSSYIHKYMSNYCLVSGRYEFAPTSSDRLAYSGLRNYLIDLGFLGMDSDGVKYFINEDYTVLYLTQIGGHRTSPEHLSKWQEGLLMIGRQAELMVVEYEKQRLAAFGELAEKVEYVAEKDVSAGYDIESFEGDGGVPESRRFIEVKAVSRWSYRFHWTRNEIEVSRIHGKSYLLYLVPVMRSNHFSIEGMVVIRDPYANVYLQDSEWLRCYEVVSFHNPTMAVGRKRDWVMTVDQSELR